LQLVEDILATCTVYDQTGGQQRTSRQSRWRLTKHSVDHISANIIDGSVSELAVYQSQSHGGLGERCGRRLDLSKIVVFGP
jgi:hypothetical protein